MSHALTAHRQTKDPILVGRDARSRWLPTYWAIEAAFALYGLSWILGLSGVALPLLAIPLAVRMLVSGKVRVPRGFGWLVVYIGWVIVSGFNLPHATSLIFFSWRLANYVSAGVFLLAIYNAPIAKLPTERVVRSAAILWVTIVLGGHLALRWPQFDFSSPLERLMPAAAKSNDFIFRYLHPAASDIHDFLGFDVARPIAPFAYTNDWGSNLTMIFPFVLLLATLVAQREVRIAIATMSALAIPPFVASLNRMAWFSVVVIAVAIAATATWAERRRQLAAIFATSIAVGLVLAVTPLGDLVSERLQTGHSDNTRADLIDQAVEATNASPLIGHGGPIPNELFPLRPHIGTQGFMWTAMVSQGYAGLAIIAMWLLDGLRRAFMARRFPEARAAFVVIVLFLVQSTTYDLVPVQFHLVAVAIALERRAAWHRANDAVVGAHSG